MMNGQQWWHSLMLSFHDLRGLPLRWLPSTVPCCMIFSSVSWRQTCPNHDSSWRPARMSTMTWRMIPIVYYYVTLDSPSNNKSPFELLPTHVTHLLIYVNSTQEIKLIHKLFFVDSKNSLKSVHFHTQLTSNKFFLYLIDPVFVNNKFFL